MTKQAAQQAFEAFSGRAADEEIEIDLPQITGQLQLIGQVTRMLYRADTVDDDVEFDHEFDGGAGPYLLQDEAQELFLGGGRYQVGNRGIVDGKPEWPKQVRVPAEGADLWTLGELAGIQWTSPSGDDGIEWDEGDGPYVLVDGEGRMHLEASDGGSDDEET